MVRPIGRPMARKTVTLEDLVPSGKELKGAVFTLYTSGDEFGTRWTAWRSHGRPGQRIDAFDYGLHAGWESCDEFVLDELRAA